LHIWLFSGTLDAFGVQTEEKQNGKSGCPMTPSVKVLYRSLGALPGQTYRNPGEASSSFYSIAKPEESPHQMHSTIT